MAQAIVPSLILLVALMHWPLLFSPVHVIALLVTKLDKEHDMSHCSDRDLNDQKRRQF